MIDDYCVGISGWCGVEKLFLCGRESAFKILFMECDGVNKILKVLSVGDQK